VKQLGFKQVKHHSGKSRVFGQLSKEKNSVQWLMKTQEAQK
jgi:hypothetical protein